MPVYIYEPDALDRMTQVEGPEWRQHQDEHRMGSCSFQAFLDEWRLAVGDRTPAQLKDGYYGEMCITVDGGGAIYGFWGWTRYSVRYSGEILFLREFAEVESTARAKAAGFRVWPEKD